MKRIFVLFFSFMLIFFALSTPAGAAEIIYKSSYGNSDVKFGIAVSGLDSAKASEILQYFGHEGGKEIFLKIENPNVSLLDTNEFKTLSQKKFKWYFSFSSTGNVDSFLTSYFQKTSNEVVVELGKNDASFAQTLKQKFPSVKIHMGKFILWPRTDVKKLLDKTSPSYLDAVTIQKDKGQFEGDLFEEVKGMYDLLFDASMDIAGTSNVKMNYPSGTKLGLTKLALPDYSNKATAYLHSVISSVVVSSVSTQSNSKKAPFKYVIIGDFFKFNAAEKKVLGTIASVLHSKPGIVWPMAIEQNGDPFDNGFFKESNTKPIVGFAGTSSIGSYIVLTNTSSSPETVKVPSSVVGLTYVSSSGTQATITANPFQMSGYETYVIVSAAVHIPGNIAPTLPPSTPSPTNPAPTIAPTGPMPTNSPSIAPTQGAPTTAIFQQPTSALFVPDSTSQNVAPTVGSDNSGAVVTFYEVSGTIEIINPKLKQLDKMLLVLNSNSKQYPPQTIEAIPIQSGTTPFQFKALATGVEYRLEAYVKSSNGFVYRGSRTIKKAEEVNIKIEVDSATSPDKLLSAVDTVLNFPVTIVQQIKRLDILLTIQATNLQRKALLLFNKNSKSKK